jgi:peptidoglycan-associated lipoprotein
MTRALFALLAAALLLAGCSTTQKQDDGAQVEERGGAGTGTEGSQTYGADTGRQSAMEQLNDPSSPLSQRIIYFDYDSSEIRADYRSIVEAHAAFLASNPTITVSLEGHADERGSREYNLALGERRAQAVKRQMVLLGVNGSQIRTTSYGEERPVVPGHDESAWSQNRRVEIIY